jgi:hypothetical protein
MPERVLINFEVTPEEKRMIERHAKKHGQTVRGYLRGCYLIDMVMTGDAQAVKIIGADVKATLREKLEGWGVLVGLGRGAGAQQKSP